MKKLNRELRQWEKSITPSVHIRLSATSPHNNFAPPLLPTKGLKCVTYPLDEYNQLTTFTKTLKIP